MNCEKCEESLGAGDISVVPESGGAIDFRVICHNCDTVQSSRVLEKNGMFYVIYKRRDGKLK